MSMLYSDYVTALSGFLPEQLANTNTATPFISGSRYNTVLPRCIEYAELRLYRDPDLDFLGTRVVDGSATATCTAGTRAVTIPSSMVVVENLNVITPFNFTPGSTGSTRNPLVPVSVPFINSAYPAQATQQQPTYYARNDQTTIILGAVPDQPYVLEFYGTTRPAPLSYANTSTFLTQFLPDLFLAASMIFMTGYQKNFGAQSGDPAQGMTWTQYFEELKRGAAVEEARKKCQGPGWTPLAPTGAATPPRG